MQVQRIDEDSLLGVVWLIKFNADRLSRRIKSDLLARLTSMPFWLNQGGRFQKPPPARGDDEEEEDLMDHWSEGTQIVWLVGGYFIGIKLRFFRIFDQVP